MICRPIQPNEADAFLRLLAGAFHLDISRARQAFYADPMFDLNRKWALFENHQMRSILTTTGMQFGWGRAIGIAGVATRQEDRGRGYAGHLLMHVLDEAARQGEGPAMLFAHQEELYARFGFATTDRVISGTVPCDPGSRGELLSALDIHRLYSQWAARDERWVVRDERRWRYWHWFHRPCETFGEGYICLEGNLVREVVSPHPTELWPVPNGTRWYGLAQVAAELGLQLSEQKEELLLMTRGLPHPVRMFMTDQF